MACSRCHDKKRENKTVVIREVPIAYNDFVKVGSNGTVIKELSLGTQIKYIVEATELINSIDVVKWIAEFEFHQLEF